MYNKEYILFSPIGGHDPMGNFSDGPMLRVCRVYKPNKVYLFFSKEMWEYRNQDDRYNYCLDRLCDELNITIKREEIFDDTLTEVHLFDEFQLPFTQILTRIHSERPDSHLIVNISSGTPAMNSCLLFLSKMLPFEITAIQVSTPQKRQNPGEIDPTKLDIKDMWQYNMDADIEVNPADDYELTRCREERYTNTLAQITKESVCRHIDNYDYDAAIREAKQIPEFLSDRAINLLRAASQRVKINPSSILNLLDSEDKKSIVPIQQGDKIALFEYLLWLNMKILRNDISDFVRGITPALYHLSFIYLKDKCGIDLKQYADERGRLWRANFEKDEKGTELLSKLDLNYQPEFKDGGYISSDSCIYLICEYAEDTDAINVFTELREFERKIRNPISHDIVKIDIEWMKNLTGTEPKIIWNKFKGVAGKTFKITPFDWECYDRMNDLIKNEIKLG